MRARITAECNTAAAVKPRGTSFAHLVCSVDLGGNLIIKKKMFARTV